MAIRHWHCRWHWRWGRTGVVMHARTWNMNLSRNEGADGRSSITKNIRGSKKQTSTPSISCSMKEIDHPLWMTSNSYSAPILMLWWQKWFFRKRRSGWIEDKERDMSEAGAACSHIHPSVYTYTHVHALGDCLLLTAIVLCINVSTEQNGSWKQETNKQGLVSDSFRRPIHHVHTDIEGGHDLSCQCVCRPEYIRQATHTHTILMLLLLLLQWNRRSVNICGQDFSLVARGSRNAAHVCTCVYVCVCGLATLNHSLVLQQLLGSGLASPEAVTDSLCQHDSLHVCVYENGGKKEGIK